MVYDLGIDVGTSYTAAAVRRPDGTVEVVGLGPIADNIPSVVYLNEDGSLVLGDAAARRAAIDPAGSAREFKRRMGDPTPLILRTSPFSAEALIGKMIDHVVSRVSDRERGRPRHTVVTHPANWGPYKLELFDQSLRLANLVQASRLAEPQAAAVAYAAEARVPTGAVVAVYDLGGGTFDAAVLRKTDQGFEPLGDTVGIEHLGGVDFDEAVLHHVRTQLGDRWPTDPDDPSLPAPMLHLRRAAMEAKELLSSEQDVAIPVLLPGVDTTVALGRRQFDAMIAPRIDDSIGALQAAIDSAGVRPEHLAAVLLVGGSSRIPLVGHMLRERFGSLVASDIDPLYAVARGAARVASARSGDPRALEPSGASPAPPSLPAFRPPPAPSPAPPPSYSPAASPPAVTAPVAAPFAGSPPPDPHGVPFGPGPQGAFTPAPAGVGAAGPPPSPPTQHAEPTQPIQRTPPASFGPPPTSVPSFAGGPGGPSAAPVPIGEAEEPKSSRLKLLVPLVVIGLLAAGGAAYAVTRSEDGTTAIGGQEATAAPGATTSGAGDSDASVATDPPAGQASAIGMLQIPAGEYKLGSDKPEPNFAETLTRTESVEAFYIDDLEVTNEQYRAFVDTKSAAVPLSWPGGRSPGAEQAAHPVQGVSHPWAVAFCTSLGKRLPTEAEWEVAARGPGALPFPWGDTAGQVTLPASGTYPGGSIPENVSGFGVHDLSGNVWEWVADSYDTRIAKEKRVLRGGQNGYLRRNSVRLDVEETSNALRIAGFRCAASSADPAVAALAFGDFEAPAESNEPTATTLAPGVRLSDAFDDSTSGWVEFANDQKRFGYHPNGFYHLETRAPNVEVLAESGIAVDAADPTSIRLTAFVEPDNTDAGGTFQYGIVFRNGSQGDGLIFVVNPRENSWAVCFRPDQNTPWAVVDKKTRTIPEEVQLEVQMQGADRYVFLMGGQVVYQGTITGYSGTGAGLVLLSYAGSKKAHIHFNEFEIRDLG